jgi:death-on-curing protein
MLGLRNEDALESALARPRQKWTYDPSVDIAGLAAAYGFGLSSGHPFNDGNKRVAFLAIVVFLGLYGFDFDAPEQEVVGAMRSLAAGRTTEQELTSWIRSRMAAQPEA